MHRSKRAARREHRELIFLIRPMALFHGNIRASGPPAQREAFRARVAALLAEDPPRGSVEEIHGEAGLCYDLKVEGGLPFPAFAIASAECPELEVHAEWVDAASGARGSALIRGGAVLEQTSREPGVPDDGVWVEAEPGGGLRLAITCFPVAPGVFAGYVLGAERDAMFRIRREFGAPGGELLATVGGEPAWAGRWRVDFAAGSCEHSWLEPPEPVDPTLWAALERRAGEFAREWVWFAEAPAEETAVERKRYAEAGREVRGANLRSAKLHLPGRPGQDGRLLRDGLGKELEWIREVIQACWTESGE
ncbi:MAG TPA: hypothetical protein VFP70_09795 [Burkholderiales bacterium]|nr:hypothetical protein [Burkholderiales bacterium]